MTRGRRPGYPATLSTGAGPDKGRGHCAPRPATPAVAFSRARLYCGGEICYACDRPIHGLGERFTSPSVTTHAHLVCAAAALKLLA